MNEILISDDEINKLTSELRQFQNGANVHTINKCITYLEWLGKPSHLKNSTRISVFPDFIKEVKISINTKSVDHLKIYMSGWF